MPVRTIPRGQTALALPSGLVVLQVRNAQQTQELHGFLAFALTNDTGVTTEAGRLCLIEVGDALLATDPHAAIRTAHWRNLWALLPPPAGAESPLAGQHQRLAELDLAIAQEESMRQGGAGGVFAGDEDAMSQSDLEHQRDRIEAEIRREMRGLIDIPDAARQVGRLGEVQTTIRRDYMQLTEQRKELAARVDSAGDSTRRLKQEETQKVVLGIVFIFLGIASLMAEGVPDHLRPMGYVVIVLGILFAWISSKSASGKESPKQAALKRQMRALDQKVSEVDERLLEADRQVRQFCASVGCTSPGQVIELQRRYEQRIEERSLLEERIAQVARRAGTAYAEGGSGAAAVAIASEQRLSELRQERLSAERELQRRSMAGGLSRPGLVQVLESANELVGRWLGRDEASWRMGEDQTPRLEFPTINATFGQKVLAYTALRVGLMAASEENPLNLPLVLDDPLKLCDDEELTDSFAPLAGLAQDGRQVIYITSRAAMLTAWRQASRARGEALTVIELGHGPAN